MMTTNIDKDSRTLKSEIKRSVVNYTTILFPYFVLSLVDSLVYLGYMRVILQRQGLSDESVSPGSYKECNNRGSGWFSHEVDHIISQDCGHERDDDIRDEEDGRDEDHWNHSNQSNGVNYSICYHNAKDFFEDAPNEEDLKKDGNDQSSNYNILNRLGEFFDHFRVRRRLALGLGLYCFHDEITHGWDDEGVNNQFTQAQDEETANDVLDHAKMILRRIMIQWGHRDRKQCNRRIDRVMRGYERCRRLS